MTATPATSSTIDTKTGYSEANGSRRHRLKKRNQSNHTWSSPATPWTKSRNPAVSQSFFMAPSLAARAAPPRRPVVCPLGPKVSVPATLVASAPRTPGTRRPRA